MTTGPPAPIVWDMEKRSLRLAFGTGLLLFAAGYFVGSLRSGHTEDSDAIPGKHSRTSSGNIRDTQEPAQVRTKSSVRPADGKKGGYGRLFDMILAGKIQLSGVYIDTTYFMPGPNVAEAFSLNESQMEELKRVGEDRLRRKQEREFQIAVVTEVSESLLVADIPADPAFAEAEVAGFMDDLRRICPPDLVEILRSDIEEAYRDHPQARHIRYTLRPDNRITSSGYEPGSTFIGQSTYRYEINVNRLGEEGQGDGAWSSRGTFTPGMHGSEFNTPRYHDLWQRARGKR